MSQRYSFRDKALTPRPFKVGNIVRFCEVSEPFRHQYSRSAQVVTRIVFAPTSPGQWRMSTKVLDAEQTYTDFDSGQFERVFP